MPYGPRSALIVFGREGVPDSALARAITRAFDGTRCAEIADYVIAFDRVLVEFRHEENLRMNAEEVADWIAGLEPVAGVDVALHEIPVRYDGADLDAVGGAHGLDVETVIALHAEPVYEVAMLGFSPGFPYLTGLDARLATPRRASPRSRVPAGSVAIGGAHTGIYSVESPGGWNLIGTTDVRVFDPGRADGEAMFLLRAGDRVKFIPVA